MGAEDADAVQPGGFGRGDACLGVLEGDDLARASLPSSATARR